ncbi:MAG: hypothetical protein IJU28_01555, partial [Clostridia bacterium]|nr:hypothetical protein [Clostridia bacterium]
MDRRNKTLVVCPKCRNKTRSFVTNCDVCGAELQLPLTYKLKQWITWRTFWAIALAASLIALFVMKSIEKKEAAAINNEITQFITADGTPSEGAEKLFAYLPEENAYSYGYSYLPSSLQARSVSELRGIVSFSFEEDRKEEYEGSTSTKTITFYKLNVKIVDLMTNECVIEETFYCDIPETVSSRSSLKRYPRAEDVNDWI